MKGSFSNYLIYFVSMVFSMIVYYTFVSLQYSEQIQGSIMLSEFMSFMFMAASAVLLLFVAIFLLYSNSFFTRSRKREIGLYSMLGLRKKSIARMMFYENLLMGVLALVIGIVFGALISKFFSMILIKLMGTSAKVDFVPSIEAIVQTVIVFMLIILFTSFQGARLIYRFKLIELFHAEKKGEQAPLVSPIITFIGVSLLAFSYWLIVRPFPEELTGNYVVGNYGMALIALSVGTHLFFRSATVFLLMLSQKNKSRYYRGTNFIGTSQLLYRIRGNARTFSLIALLSAVTISFFGATYSGYYGNEISAKEDVPFTYTHLSGGQSFDSEIEKLINEDTAHPVQAQLDIPVLVMEGQLSFELDYLTSPIKIIAASTFNQASRALDRDVTVHLSGQQAAVVKPRLTDFRQASFEGQHLTLSESKKNSKLQLVQLVEGSVLPFDYPDFFVIVSDEWFKQLAKQTTTLTYKAYEVEDEKTTEAVSSKLATLIDGDFQVHSSFYTVYKEGKEGSAMNLFVFGFLGLVFLAATGSVIYFKQLTEAGEAKPNYEILRKIGVDNKVIRSMLHKQTRFVFGLPLLVGILHSTVVLYFISNFMSNLIGVNMVVPMLIAMVAFIGIYAGYYVLTVTTYYRIVCR